MAVLARRGRVDPAAAAQGWLCRGGASPVWAEVAAFLPTPALAASDPRLCRPRAARPRGSLVPELARPVLGRVLAVPAPGRTLPRARSGWQGPGHPQSSRALPRAAPSRSTICPPRAAVPGGDVSPAARRGGCPGGTRKGTRLEPGVPWELLPSAVPPSRDTGR